MRRLYIFFIIFSLFITPAAAQQPFTRNSPKHEVRAVWLTTIGGIDWPHSYARSEYSINVQKRELTQILDKLQQAQINTVLVQTRVRGTTIFPSSYEPWDGCLSGNPGRSPGYDALKYVIDECHKRGMEVHAWVVTIPVGKMNGAGVRNLNSKFPGLVKNIKGDGYMNPEDSRTGNYLADFCKEIAHNYDVDGIHLDYIRYPEDWKITVSRNQGRQNITNIVRKIHDAVKREKPWIKMSCSPIGKFDDLTRYWSHGWNAYNKVCQDAQGWLRSGLMDELFPMMYFRNDQFFPFAIDWKEQSYGKIIVPGLGIYFLNPREGNWKINDVTKEMNLCRTIGAGYAFFRSKFFTDNTQGIYDFTKEQFNYYPALVPAMTWANNHKPMAPGRMQVEKNRIIWTPGRAMNNSPYITYNVYASRTCPVDVNDARNLVAVRLMKNYATVKTSGMYFAVTAMDRYGNESEPLQSHTEAGAAAPGQHSVNLMDCDGKYLSGIPHPSTLDAKLLIIKNLQGSTITSRTYTNKVYVGNLPQGMYELRSLDRRDVSHRLGFFIVKRKK